MTNTAWAKANANKIRGFRKPVARPMEARTIFTKVVDILAKAMNATGTVPCTLSGYGMFAQSGALVYGPKGETFLNWKFENILLDGQNTEDFASIVNAELAKLPVTANRVWFKMFKDSDGDWYIEFGGKAAADENADEIAKKIRNQITRNSTDYTERRELQLICEAIDEENAWRMENDPSWYDPYYYDKD